MVRMSMHQYRIIYGLATKNEIPEESDSVQISHDPAEPLP